MKIIHITYDDIKNPWCGGGGAYRVFKVNEIKSNAHQITVLTGNFPGARTECINGVYYKRLGLKSSYILSRISFTFLVPFFLVKHKSDIVINDCSYFAPCFADLYTRRPVINIIHHLMEEHAFNIYPLLGFFPYIFERIFLRIAKHVITSSKGVKNTIQKKYSGKSILNIANGIPDNLFRLMPEEYDFILFLGRIDIYMKGLDILIEAFSKIKNRETVLRIAGGGKRGDVRELKKLVGDFNLEKRVELLGKVSETEKYELLRTCMFLVMPSRFEGWGITGAEANAAGKPVLGTKIKGLSEAVVHEKTALLIEAENVDKLTAALDLLIGNKDKRVDLGRKGREWAKGFSWISISSEQFEFYRTVLNG